MANKKIIDTNKQYWNEHADLWFGTTALPEYGVKFLTEDELHFFKDVSGKKVLEICCGSGHSLKYLADRKAGELWGVDLSQKQLENADKFLKENGYRIGWATDLQGVFDKIASYLKKDGIFIFSWHHTLNYCVAWSCAERREIIEDNKLTFNRSYFDESYFTMPVHDSQIILCNRKISTYVNALAKAGFVIEQMIEQNDRMSMESAADLKAKMVPVSMCFKARKL